MDGDTSRSSGVYNANANSGEVHRRRQLEGMTGIYELAKEWTDEFEKLHEGRQWDGEFFDEVMDFLISKNKA